MKIALAEDNVPRTFRSKLRVLQGAGILGELEPRSRFDDDPKFWIYTCQYLIPDREPRLGLGYGSSVDRNRAAKAAIAEAVERYCLLSTLHSEGVTARYRDLRKAAVDPRRFVPFSSEQLIRPEFGRFRVTRDSVFRWVPGYSLTTRSPVLVPAQLVYTHYDPLAIGEPLIRYPISTGAAAGLTLDGAILKGICEVIERDAYMITYLAKLPRHAISPQSNPLLERIADRFSRYNLRIHLIDTTLQFPATAICAVLIDPTGIGPAVTVGMAAALDPLQASVTAALEALRRNIFIRERQHLGASYEAPPASSTEAYSIWKQDLWARPHMIREIDFLTSVPTAALRPKTRHPDGRPGLDRILVDLGQEGMDVFYVDLTLPKVGAVGFRVVKVLIPELFPLYLDDRYPYLGGRRLYQLPRRLGLLPGGLSHDDLNPIPHPF